MLKSIKFKKHKMLNKKYKILTLHALTGRIRPVLPKFQL